ncbi:MAG: c-type cytochrome [Rhodomicrobium sp.]
MRKYVYWLALIIVVPAPAHAWLIWSEMVHQISIKPQANPLPFPQRSVPVPGTATMRPAGQDAASNMPNPIQPSPESIHKGKQMFMIYCTPCHGTSGTGNGTVGEKLSARPFDLTSDMVQSLPDGFIFGYLTYGGTVMPNFANDLSPTERWHVINFLHHGLVPAAPQQEAGQTK